MFEIPAPELAPALLGLWLIRATRDGLAAGVIVETEAYGGVDDRASHARAGRTKRTEPMFGPPGHAYVYLVYGLHSCLNVVSGTDGEAGAVLIRAVAPTIGLPMMRARRQRPADADDRLAAGPARLCQALAVDRSLDGHDLTAGRELWLADPEPAARHALLARGVACGPRIGVAYAGPDWAARPWRFGLRDHPALSGPFRP